MGPGQLSYICYSTLFDVIRSYFEVISSYSMLYDVIRRYSMLFDVILRLFRYYFDVISTLFDVIRGYSTLFPRYSMLFRRYFDVISMSFNVISMLFRRCVSQNNFPAFDTEHRTAACWTAIRRPLDGHPTAVRRTAIRRPLDGRSVPWASDSLRSYFFL